jgi:hypothetical protein
MNAAKLTQEAQNAVNAFTLQREQLATLRNSNAQDLNFIRWRISTTGVFRHFLPDSKTFAMFEGIKFDPGNFKSYAEETLGPDSFIRDCNAAETCLRGAIEHIHICGLDKRVKDRADAAAGQASQGTQQGLLALISRKLRQLLRDIGEHLKKTVRSAAAYLKEARNAKELADVSSVEVSVEEQRRRSPAGSANDLNISFRIDGTPPSPQVIKMMASRPVTISRLEYLLPDERSIVSQEYSLEGESIEVPLSHQCIDELYNAPRPVGSTYENSMKFRITTFEGGRTRTYTFRAQIAAVVAGGTVYRKVFGSKDFVSGA